MHGVFPLKKTILLLNGPNLNLLGKRLPHVYGKETLEEIVTKLTNQLPNNFQILCFQSNSEGEIVNFLNQQFLSLKEQKSEIAGLIVNAGAYTHTSIAIRDAIEVFTEEKTPLIEVHLSNIFKRESFRHHSYLSSLANAVICGLGSYGYEVALQKIVSDAT